MCIAAVDHAFGKSDGPKKHSSVEKLGDHHYSSSPQHYKINLHKMKAKKMKKHKKQHVIHNNYYSYPLFDYPKYSYPTYVHNEYVHEQPAYPQYSKVYANPGGYGHQAYQKGHKDVDYKGHKDIYTYHEMHHHGYEHQKKDGHHSHSPIYEEHKNEPGYVPKKEGNLYPKVPSSNSNLYVYDDKDKAYKKAHSYSKGYDYHTGPSHQNTDSKSHKDIYTYPKVPESEHYSPAKDQKMYGKEEYNDSHPKESKDYGKGHSSGKTDYNGNKVHFYYPKVHESDGYAPSQGYKPHASHPSNGYQSDSYKVPEEEGAYNKYKYTDSPTYAKDHEKGGYTHPKESHRHPSKGHGSDYERPKHHAGNDCYCDPYGKLGHPIDASPYISHAGVLGAAAQS
jgi:hypothetical protein